jgi:hypothetical protein
VTALARLLPLAARFELIPRVLLVVSLLPGHVERPAAAIGPARAGSA